MIHIGQIIRLRNRLWRVDEYHEHEITASPIDSGLQVRKRFLTSIENIKPANLDAIRPDLSGDYALQQLLLRAYRFELLHGSAPFLSLQRSAIVPYNYQLVPLVMALEKARTRMLIADDVGLGKTIEAGLIISELMQRGRIRRVLYLTPANLKEQWQDSLRYFFHIDPVIISSFTRKEFEKKLPAGANPWQYFPHCIASVDYAKSPNILHLIQEQSWDLLLVDEVHLCARPHLGTGSEKQKRRYELIRILGKQIPHVLFLTATPHNGYSDSFASLLEILNPKIINYSEDRQEVQLHKQKARYNVCQRNRKHLDIWFENHQLSSPFPARNQKEILLEPQEDMQNLLDLVQAYGDNLIHLNSGSRNKMKVASWVSLHLQKRAISSPYALLQSLQNRIQSIKEGIGSELKANIEEDAELLLFVNDQEVDERLSEEFANQQLDSFLSLDEEIIQLEKLLTLTKTIHSKKDVKLMRLKNSLMKELFIYDNKIILFTKYKDTLDYLIKHLSKGADFDLLSMHGGMSLKKRQDIFQQMETSKKALLIATDVISEGLNLQRLTSILIHYELPWNPNRLEQRNGRVDRIGQKKECVQIRTLVLKETMDTFILEKLIHKASQIREDRGYSGAYFGDEEALTHLIQEASKLNGKKRKQFINFNQLNLFEKAQYNKQETIRQVSDPFRKETLDRIASESFYDSIDIALPDIDRRIEETQRLIGSREQIEQFVNQAVSRLGGVLIPRKDGFYKLHLHNYRLVLPNYGTKLERVSFNPEDGLTHPDVVVLEIGHPVVRRLIETVKSDFFDKDGNYGRTAAFFSNDVSSVTFLYHVLVRFTVGRKEKRIVEELISFGLEMGTGRLLDGKQLTNICAAKTTEQIDAEWQKELLQSEGLQDDFYQKVLKQQLKQREDALVEERQQLYEKIIRESQSLEDITWAREIMFIEPASTDILAITIVIPL